MIEISKCSPKCRRRLQFWNGEYIWSDTKQGTIITSNLLVFISFFQWKCVSARLENLSMVQILYSLFRNRLQYAEFGIVQIECMRIVNNEKDIKNQKVIVVRRTINSHIHDGCVPNSVITVNNVRFLRFYVISSISCILTFIELKSTFYNFLKITHHRQVILVCSLSFITRIFISLLFAHFSWSVSIDK